MATVGSVKITLVMGQIGQIGVNLKKGSRGQIFFIQLPSISVFMEVLRRGVFQNVNFVNMKFKS